MAIQNVLHISGFETLSSLLINFLKKSMATIFDDGRFSCVRGFKIKDGNVVYCLLINVTKKSEK